MRKKLKELRIERGYETQEKFAIRLGVSLKTYNNIERGYSFPREPLLKLIMEALDTKDLSIFDNTNDKQRGDISYEICNYMNALNKDEDNKKIYTIEIVAAIRKGLKLELEDRKEKNIIIRSNTQKGKWEIYQRAAEKANEEPDKEFDCITAKDVCLFKNCTRLESEIRTGKTTWGIAKERKRLGCNPVSGYIGKRLRLKREKTDKIDKLNIKLTTEFNEKFEEVAK